MFEGLKVAMNQHERTDELRKALLFANDAVVASNTLAEVVSKALIEKSTKALVNIQITQLAVSTIIAAELLELLMIETQRVEPKSSGRDE